MGDLKQFTRRRLGPGKIALAVLLAVLMTALTFAILSVILWGFASLVH